MNRSARLFRSLHDDGDVLFLPCVWDATSARVVSGVPGVRALGTTSAGMAAAVGLPDGQRMGSRRLLAGVRAITAATALPVSVDIEAGYGGTPRDVGALVAAVRDAGAVGVNIEDGAPEAGAGGGLTATAVHAARVAAAKEAAGDALFVNARTDVWWRGGGAGDAERFEEGAGRLRAYLAAGADGVFAPGFPGPGPAAGQEAAIASLVQRLGGAPLNLLASPSLPPLDRLRGLGVRRVSSGSALYRLAMAAAARACAEVLGGGGPRALAGEADLPYRDLAALLAAGPVAPAGEGSAS